MAVLATVCIFQRLVKKADKVNLKYDLFESGFYRSKREIELNELSAEVFVSQGESLKECTPSKRLTAFELNEKDFQCSSAIARYLSDLVEIHLSFILKHGLHDDSLYNYRVNELRIFVFI